MSLPPEELKGIPLSGTFYDNSSVLSMYMVMSRAQIVLISFGSPHWLRLYLYSTVRTSWQNVKLNVRFSCRYFLLATIFLCDRIYKVAIKIYVLNKNQRLTELLNFQVVLNSSRNKTCTDLCQLIFHSVLILAPIPADISFHTKLGRDSSWNLIRYQTWYRSSWHLIRYQT
jgi:hypothetical protein